MATINFIDKQTVIPASWLNEVDNVVHTLLSNPTTVGDIRTALAVYSTTEVDAVVQAAADAADAAQADIDAHLGDTTDAHAASAITNTPAGNIAATTVQAAIDELDSEKQPLDATLTALAGTLTGANKIPYATGVDTASELGFVDEDDMISDSATSLPSQQSVKAYVDNEVSGSSTLLVETEVTGSAVTSVDITGLDIATHKSYRIEIDWYNPTGAGSNLSCFANGDTTAANYRSQLFQISGSTTTGSLTSSATITTANSGVSNAITVDIRLVPSGADNFMHAFTNAGNVASGTSVIIQMRHMNHIASQSNITQLTFTASAASSIGIGSKIRIYRGDK
jgi:hypothetical protein